MDRQTFLQRMITGAAVVASVALLTGLVVFTDWGKFIMGLITMAATG